MYLGAFCICFWLVRYLFSLLMYLFAYGLYMSGGDIMVFFFFFFSCFTCSTLAIDLYYEVIHDMSFILCFCEIKKLFCFTCIFHTCVYVFVKCYRNI